MYGNLLLYVVSHALCDLLDLHFYADVDGYLICMPVKKLKQTESLGVATNQGNL